MAETNSRKRICFLCLPNHGGRGEVYAAVTQAARTADFVLRSQFDLRAPKLGSSQRESIKTELAESDCVVADITELSSNIASEIGLAEGMGIHVLIISQGERGLSVAEFERTANTAITSSTQPTVQYGRGPDMGGGVGGLLYTVRDTTTKYNLSNVRGDIVAQSDSTGTLTWTASYEAYGKRTKETGTNADKQRANTKDEDPTGLLNEGHRYRDIETGVWLSRDPAGFVDGPNLYAYVRQNPWTSFDPDGLATKSDHQWAYDNAKVHRDKLMKTDISKYTIREKFRIAGEVQSCDRIMKTAQDGIAKIEATAKNVNQAIDVINWGRRQLGHSEIPFHINPDTLDDESSDHRIVFEISSNWSGAKVKAAEAVTSLALGGASKLGRALMPRPMAGVPILPGQTNWPANRGFMKPPTQGTIQPGSVVDRYGDPTGTFVSPAGTPFPARALPAESAAKQLHTYEVVKPIRADTGVASPWFGQPGGGVQIELPKQIDELMDAGFLRELK